MEKKKKAPFLKLVPANLHAFESSDQEERESKSDSDSVDSNNDLTKNDPIFEILEQKEIENTSKNNQLGQDYQDDESSQDDLFVFKSQDPCIKKLKNSKSIQNDKKKPAEKDIESKETRPNEKKKISPSKFEVKKSKNRQHPTNDKKQRKIFEFGSVTNLPKEDPDEFYETIQKIYTYFNNKKSIPLILSVIHQSAGNICEAIYRLANDAYDYNEESIDFSYSSICSVSDDLAKYFI